jgi:uncharacterized protein
MPRKTDPLTLAGRARGPWAAALVAALALALPTRSTLAQDAAAQNLAAYLTTRDGTRLAANVSLPAAHSAGDRRPALLELTRYWRASEDPETGQPRPSLDPLELAALAAGYAIVQVDVRGSGASFGSRQVEYGPPEVHDGWDVLDWIVRQPWSDGRVGAHGISYTGTTAELLTAVGHPALKAVSPGWSDFDAYRSPARPYGLYASDFIETWGHYVAMQDANDPRLGGLVQRVDADPDGSLRAAAVGEHRANAAVAASIAAADFRDEPLAGSPYSFADLSSLHWRRQIEASGVPMLVLASWLDSGTAEGALWRFANFSNPQWVVILASMHGGGAHASPYVVSSEPLEPIPSASEQVALRLAFFDHFVRGVDRGVGQWPRVRYFNLGEEAYRETDVWPPAGFGKQTWFLSEEHGLEAGTQPDPDPGRGAPRPEAIDEYTVDFAVSTGGNNRWATQMGQPVLGLDHREAMDARMLTYTGPTLESDLQITGFPAVHLWIRSSHADGAFLVYLEDVAPDGRSRYLTEGGLRAIHRKVSPTPGLETFGPFHSFARADADPLAPGELAELDVRMLPISVLVRRGHRLRLAIAGADAAIFARFPVEGTPTVGVALGGAHPSWLELPVEGGWGAAPPGESDDSADQGR